MTALVDRLEQLHAEATQPPWDYSDSEVLGIVQKWADEGGIHYGRDVVEAVGAEGDKQAETDRALIVELRNALPELLAVVRAAQDFMAPRHHWRADENFPADEFTALKAAAALFGEEAA